MSSGSYRQGLDSCKMLSSVSAAQTEPCTAKLSGHRPKLPRHHLSATAHFRQLDSKLSKVTFLRRIWSLALLPRMIPLPVEATWTTVGYNVIFHFSLSLFGRAACAIHMDMSRPATRRFHHIDLALMEYYGAVGHEAGARRGVKYVLAESIPAYPIPSFRQWYEFVTTGPPSNANKNPIYHALTRLVGWSHTILVVVELTIDKNGQKDFKGLQWDLNATANTNRIERKEWAWRESSLFLPLGMTTMGEEQIEELARAFLKKFPEYHLIFRNCAFFVMMMLGTINADKLRETRRREDRACYRWLTMRILSLVLIFIFVVIWCRQSMLSRVV